MRLAADQLLSAVASTSGRAAPLPALMRQLAALLQSPALEDLEGHELVARLARLIGGRPPATRAALLVLLAQWTGPQLSRCV